MRYAFFVALLILFGVRAAVAQVVQRPVVGTMSVNTTVSVPDRGSAFLGGTSSAQSGRSQYGPLRSGSSLGLSRQSSSISTHVYIHDLQAMDEALLRSRPAVNELPTRESNRSLRRTEPSIAATHSPVERSEKAAKFEELGRKAEQAGKIGVAKLHWQMAAKFGSHSAEQRLAELARSASTTAAISPVK